MKRVFSSLSLICSLPSKVIKKLPKDNFFAGLVFGAIFSLLVNIVTVHVQEEIIKQRVLEAVEWEIYNNSAQAKNAVDQVLGKIKNSENPNPFFTYQLYSRDLWEHSTEPLQYIAQLPPDVQAQVVVYYTVTLKGENDLIQKTSDYADKALFDCYPLNGFTNSVDENRCKLLYYQLLKNYSDTADDVYKKSMTVLDVFHPTKDRLNSWFLRLMMGDKSVRVLSRK